MIERIGADLVADALGELDVRCVFAVASVHNLPILHALRKRGSVEIVSVRHEQAAVHAADGYARASGRLGVAITSTGPGAANAMGGLFEAAFASQPVLMLTGQIESAFLGRGRGFIHEAERQADMLRTVAPHVWTSRFVDELGDQVLAAGHATGSGRPMPAVVEIPVDLQYAATSATVASPAPVRRRHPAAERLDRAATLLGQAKRPLLWAGGGVISGDATEELLQLAERLQVPVVTSIQGRGAIPETHDLSLGCLTAAGAVRDIVEDADVVVAIGTRFQMYQTDFWRLRLNGRLVHIDVDPTVISRTYPADVAVPADARLALSGLLERVHEGRAEPTWLKRAVSAAQEARAQARAAIGPDHEAIMDIIRKFLAPEAALVRDCTVAAYYWADNLLPVLRPRTSMNPTSAAIGPGLPLAIGAVTAIGQRSVVIHGDGGIMLSVAELATVAQFELPLTICVFVDGGYGVLRGIQEATFGLGAHDVDLPPPNFVGLGASLGVPGERVTSVAEFERAFARSVEGEGPFLIEIDQNAIAPMNIQEGRHLLIG